MPTLDEYRERVKELMSKEDTYILYWHHSGNTIQVIDWYGVIVFPLICYKWGRHNMCGKRLDVWFKDLEGKQWHGVHMGDNTYIRCKRLKGKVL